LGREKEAAFTKGGEMANPRFGRVFCKAFINKLCFSEISWFVCKDPLIEM
jgi:hypothetical protein